MTVTPHRGGRTKAEEKKARAEVDQLAAETARRTRRER